MTKFQLKIVLMFFLVLLLSSSCTVTTRNIDPNEEIHYDESYDFSDKKRIVEKLVASLIPQTPFSGMPDRPVVIVYPIANRTTEHISTSGITDDIRMELIRSGKFRFVNETQRQNIEKEMNYQYGGSVSSQTRFKRARQIGAQYILSGTLRSIDKKESKQFRLTKKTLKYYSLNLELTNLETGIIDWADSVEIIREASKPFIGW